jgi:peptidylprolyl isomerase
MAKRALLPVMIILLGAALAACGSSKAPGIQLAPSAGSTTVAAIPTSSTTTTSSSTSSQIKPPAALATKPVVKPPSGPPPSGLVTKDLVKGTGKAASDGSTITVNYVGILYKGGKEFDSSWKRGQPATFSLENGKLISGWTQGIPGMRVGGRRELIVPAELAYGKQGQPPTIPPNAPLVFVVDLLGT